MPRSNVAVIIAAYNAAATVGQAVQSALRERQVAEVWVVDDCSSDDGVEKALACDDGTGRLRILRQAQNGGPAAARNRALALSQMDWMCVLDADDYFLPGRIGRLLAVSAGVEMVADALIKIDASDVANVDALVANVSTFEIEPQRMIDFASFVTGNLTRSGRSRQELGFIKPLMKRAFLEQHGLAYDEKLRLGEDYHLYASILALGGRLRMAPPQGYVAVVHATSLSSNHSIADLRALRDCDEDLARLRSLDSNARRALRAHFISVDKRLQWRRLIEAVKANDLAQAFSTFTSWPVAGFLALRLTEQAWLRTLGCR